MISPTETIRRACLTCGSPCEADLPIHLGIARSQCLNCDNFNYFSRVKRIDIGLSEVCNLSCNMCRRPQERATIPKDKVLGIIKEAAAIGVTTLSFSGGEPFIYPGFRDCLLYALDLGLTVEIVTNGTLIVESDLKILEKTKCVTISVDGPEAEHDYIRGHPGCWRRTMSAIDYLAKSSVTWGTNTVMQEANASVIFETWRQIRSHGRPSYVGFGHVEVVPETAHLQMGIDKSKIAQSQIDLVREECRTEGIHFNDDCMQKRGCFAMFNDKSRRYRPIGGCQIPQEFIGISSYGFFPCWHQGRVVVADSLIQALESSLCSEIISEALERRCIGCNSANYTWSERWVTGMTEAFKANEYDVGLVHLSSDERLLGHIRKGKRTLPLLERALKEQL